MGMKNVEGSKISNRKNLDDKHLGQLAKKVRVRSPYSFANINLLGKCNVDCYFCLGKDLKNEFEKYQTLGVHFKDWPNWGEFVARCKRYQIPQIYLTGQNTDSLLYKHLDELIDYLKVEGFFFGLRTNGLAALSRMEQINKCTTCWGDAVHYSVHTIRPETQKKIMGTSIIPDWKKIIPATNPKIKVAFVLNRFNVNELYEVLDYLTMFNNFETIQIRKVCTDNRYAELEEDMILFEEKEIEFASKYPLIGEFETAKIYMYGNKKVCFWRTVGTTVNSINYFSNGVLSDDYFVIEGYSLEKGITLGSDISDNPEPSESEFESGSEKSGYAFQ